MLIFLVVTGAVFAVKLLYTLSVALALPVTRGALYVSTSRRRVEIFAKAVAMQPGQVMMDLGCGDGRVLRCIHRRYGVKAVGYERNPLAYINARLLCLGRRGITVRFRDFRKADLSGADVVFCYLFPDALQDLADKLDAELKPGATVVSANFALPKWRPERILRSDRSLREDPLYVYRKS